MKSIQTKIIAVISVIMIIVVGSFLLTSTSPTNGILISQGGFLYGVKAHWLAYYWQSVSLFLSGGSVITIIIFGVLAESVMYGR